MSKSPIVQRALAPAILKALKHYPIISVTGPRQSGKTTLCHLLGPKYTYVNLELEHIKSYAKANPKKFLEEYKDAVILDEVQAVPELFPYLQYFTDLRKKKGEYVLSGSQNFVLMEKISQSLAGRIAIFSLLPFSLKELKPYVNWNKTDWNTLCIRGFYPRLFTNKKMDTQLFYKSYEATYVQKDISQILQVKNKSLYKKFIKLCANRTGSVINTTEIGASIGIDNKTANQWLSVLEGSYIAYTMPAYFENLNKRVIKKPKLYFYDTGLLCYLLGIKNQKELQLHPIHGHIFENFIINEIKKDLYNKGKADNVYFWQDSNQKEIDLIIEKNNTIYAYEIKSSGLAQASFLKNLNSFRELVIANDKKIKTHLLFAGDESYKNEKNEIISWRTLIDKDIF
jgi:uncharacterized protein